MDFALILNTVSDLSEKLSCRIGFEPKTSLTQTPAQRSRLSYYDKEKDMVIIWQEMVRSEKDVVIRTVHALISERGLKGVLGPKYNDFCVFLANGISRHSVALPYAQQLTFGEDILQNMDRGTADIACRRFFKMTGLEFDSMYTAPFVSAVEHFQKAQIREMVNSNNTDALDLEFKRSVIEGGTGRFLEFGKMSDAYRRIGYPDNRFLLSTSSESMKAALADPVLRKNILSSNFVEKVQSPLAIVDSSNNRYQSYAAVLDVKDKDGNYLMLYLPSPDAVMKNMSEKGASYAVNIGTTGHISPENLVCKLLPKDGVNRTKYLQPTLGPDSSSFAISRILKHVKDHPSKDHPLSPTFLNLVEKEIDLFRNPVSSAKFRFLYGMSREERMRQKQEEELASMAALSSTRVSVAEDSPVIRRPEQKSFKERLATRLSAHRFGDALIRKMTADGIRTASDLISIGEQGVRDRYGARALRTAVAFLSDYNLNFDCMSRHDSLTAKMELEKMDPEALDNNKYEDLFRTLSVVPDNINSVSIPMPVTERGNYIGGADAVALVAKMASTPRWQGSNIFITREEAERHGLTIDPLAIATVVEHKGKNTVMYNIADTSMKDNPEKLRDTVSRISSHTLSASSYMTTLLSSLRSTRKDMIRDLYGHFQTMYNTHVHEALVGRKAPSLKAARKEQPKEKICLDRLEPGMKRFAKEELIPEMTKNGIPVRNIKELVENGVTEITAKGINAKVFFNSATVYAQDLNTGRSFGDFLLNLRRGTPMTTALRGRPGGKGNGKSKKESNDPEGPGGGPHM